MDQIQGPSDSGYPGVTVKDYKSQQLFSGAETTRWDAGWDKDNGDNGGEAALIITDYYSFQLYAETTTVLSRGTNTIPQHWMSDGNGWWWLNMSNVWQRKKPKTYPDFFLKHSKLDGTVNDPADESLLLLLKNRSLEQREGRQGVKTREEEERQDTKRHFSLLNDVKNPW